MPTYVRTQLVEHPVGDDGRVVLKVTSADTSIRGVDGETARVRGTFEIRAGSEEEADRIFQEVRLRIATGDRSLAVEEPADHNSIGSILARLFAGRGSVDLSVEAELPHHTRLELAGTSADVQVEELWGDQRYATVSGDLFLNELGGDVRVSTISGDVTLRGKIPVSLNVDSVSGDLSLSAPTLHSLRLNSVSGDVEIEGELAPFGDFRVDTVSGDVSVALVGSATFHVRGISSDIDTDLAHRLEGRMDRRRVIIGDGRPDFIFNSMSGDLSITGPRRFAGPRPPAPPPPPPPPPPRPAQVRAVSSEEQMAILQALERGEIDVDEAARRLAGEPPR
ncbi:MAG TPA: DUF4097 family beta strand repeat-containing protein [candidate division Zixibacteria bacterium]|nr:DUF4097 family beta strand repeat-containing protein [candidate division Zixibacteria bacterium]